MSTLYETALQYRKKGWSVIPLQPKTKLPVIKSWAEFQKRLPTEDELKRWFYFNPNRNIAIVCGEISNIIVVDVDVKDGAPDVKGLELPPTLSAKTGSGGSHLIYTWRKGLIGPKVAIRKGIDIRSDASYIVVAPSIHPNGKSYEWVDFSEPVVKAPVWLEEGSNSEEKEQTDWKELADGEHGTGLRNMSATKMAGKLMYDLSPELWDAIGLPAFKEWNNTHNTPPLSVKELMSVWESIKKTHLKNNNVPPKSDLLNENEEDEILKIFKKNKTEGTFLLAKYIINKYNIITIGEKQREMFVYQNGIYHPAENLIIFPEIQRILKDNVTLNAKTETLHKIADATSFPRSIFTSADIRYIPLKNGVYDIETKKLLPHSPDYRFTFQFPIIFDENAKCPKTEQFFDDVLLPEQRVVVEEWIGYYFYRLYAFKKAIIFVGEGNTGKTTLLETITNLLGVENISSVSIQKISSDKFGAIELYGKHGNIVDELSAKDITDTGNFKMATGNGSMTGEHKYGNKISFVNFAKLTFACNKIPDVKDMDDEAYFQRWMVISFCKTIAKKIPNFIKYLTTEEERSGLFNLAMSGLNRLLTNGEFSYDKSAIDTKTEMMKSGSSVAVFVSSMLIPSDGNEVSKTTMYDAYVDFCRVQGSPIETMDMFGKKFLFYTTYASEGLIAEISGKRVRGWRNVDIKKTEKQIIEETKANDEFNGL